jgi:hypothetical protein
MSYCNNGKKEVQGKGMPYGAPFGRGDFIEAELDMDKRTLEFFKNGISQGIAY